MNYEFQSLIDVSSEYLKMISDTRRVPRESIDKLVDGELIDAAACYLYSDDYAERLIAWPFGDSDWRPSDRRSNLIRAAAFIIEELDRMDRERIR